MIYVIIYSIYYLGPDITGMLFGINLNGPFLQILTVIKALCINDTQSVVYYTMCTVQT